MDLKNYTIKKIYTGSNIFKYSKGSFSVEFAHKKSIKKIYFNYKIDADIVVYKSAYQIKKNQPITLYNTYKKSVKFKRLYTKPIIKIDNYIATNYIQKDTILNSNNTKQKPLISKGDKIIAFLITGGIEVSFEATALKSGKLGEIIDIIKKDGTRFSASIIANKRVIIN
jgi:flagella basal body P-ring formation protein FlgA